MRTSGLIVVGVTALSGLFGAVTPYAPPANAGITMPQVLPPRGCDQEPPEARTYGGNVPAQEAFDAEAVWELSTGAGVTVAVLDTGVDTSHPQLRGADIANGADFAGGNGGGTGRRDCAGAGTADVSLIAAQQVDDVKFRGLAYDAKILPIVTAGVADRSSQEVVATSPARLASAINLAVRQGADVIDVSIPVYEDHPALQDAIENALAEDVVVVAAVGDKAVKADPEKARPPNPGPDPYPASYDGVVGVAGLNGKGIPLEGSQYGGYVDLAAPGNAVAANRGGNGHATLSGTHIAAAFVSATAALIRARWPELSADEVARRLRATANPAPVAAARAGKGVVDPLGSLTDGLSDEDPVEPVGMAPHSPDPAELAREQEWAFSGAMAMTVGALGILLASAMLVTLTLVPRGKRRGWRPGRAKSFPSPVDDEMPPAPVKLFEDLETK